MNEPAYASLNITFAGQNGDLPDPVLFDATDEQVRTMATEAVRAGGVRGLDLHATADFTDFVVDRVAAHDGLPHRLLLRPKTPFGATSDGTIREFAELTPSQNSLLKLAALCMPAAIALVFSDFRGTDRKTEHVAQAAVDIALALLNEVKTQDTL